jgi:outer membrane protein assembly factor BamB
LKQKGLAVGIIVLFIVSSLLPMSIGSHVTRVENDEYAQEEQYQQYMNDWHVQFDSFSTANERDGSVSGNENTSRGLPIKSIVCSTGGPMDSPWSMFGHDVVHTCRSPYSTENNTGVEIWRVRGDETGSVWGSALIDTNGLMYFGTMGADGSLYALYPNGTRKWKFTTLDLIWGTPAISEEGIIYFTTWGTYHYFYALNLDDGTEEWSIKIEGATVSSPSIAEDGTLYFGDNDNIIYAINPDGTEKWRYTTGDIVMGSPAIGQDGTIYIGSCDYYFYALNPNGTLRWRFETGGEIKGSASIALDGTIYIPSLGGYFYALYPNGTMKWKASTGGIVASAGVALAQDGTIYVGTEILRAYYPDGTLKWSVDVQGDIYGTVPAVSADGTIYVSAGNCLVAVNPDGTEKWRTALSDEQIRSSPSIGPDDRVYVGSTYSEYGYLYAIGVLDSNAPTAPTIIGKIKGKVEKSYDYLFRSTSPIGNDVFYQIDWGDGSITDWIGPYSSGESITVNHSWSDKGNYTIKARAKDIDNLWGPWGELEVTMPYTYEPPQFPFIQWLFERFPNAFPILRYLL